MIRLGHKGDIPALVELGAKFHAESGMADIAGYVPEDFAATLEGMIASEMMILLVAEDEKPVGMAGAVIFPFYFNSAHRTAQEMFWYVAPEARGGTGTALLGTLETVAKGKGCESLMMVELDHIPCGAIYEGRGYRRAERSWIRRL